MEEYEVITFLVSIGIVLLLIGMKAGPLGILGIIGEAMGVAMVLEMFLSALFGKRIRAAKKPGKGFSLAGMPGPLAILFFPITAIHSMIVGDPVEDGLRARRREISAEMDRKNKEENGMFNQGKVKKAGDDEVKRYLASVKS